MGQRKESYKVKKKLKEFVKTKEELNQVCNRDKSPERNAEQSQAVSACPPSTPVASTAHQPETSSSKAPEKCFSASKVKLEHCEIEEEKTEFDKEEELTGFRFMDVLLLINFVKQLLCPVCKNPLGVSKRLSRVKETRYSMASIFTFICKCGASQKLESSDVCGRTYEINRRFPTAVFSLGKNLTQAKRFLGNMNMPPPPNISSWYAHKELICKATEKVAHESKQKAADEIKEKQGDEITVSVDGSWQRRGFASKHGVVTALTVNGNKSKVLDTHVLSNHCKACVNKENDSNDQNEFAQWKEQHQPRCEQNHVGTAAGMEPKGAEEIFRRSWDTYKLKYTGYLGDGDSKAFSTVSGANPPIYPGAQIRKYECCGHVQKRMYRQLTSKVQECKRKMFRVKEGRIVKGKGGKLVKGIGGQGKLTKKAMLKIQGHYGEAIRKIKNNVSQMKKDIWAILEHRNRKHDNCGQWCPSKQIPPCDPNKHALPDFVCETIRPVFERLTSSELLEKCAHGGSQNSNESFHQIIWQHCPKTGFNGLERLRLAVAESTIVYNDGETGRLPVFTAMGMPQGHYTKLCFRDLDHARVAYAERKAEKAAKEHRMSKGRKTLASMDTGNYLSGAF